jgi:NADPH-dependent 2,4-dienoyl-CoA reductase/sulfur reductase-like enzyme/peroxiredoxin family protein/TusA-related sulfurtransferase/rhodanese-related sulfurtransferase
MDKKRVLIVGGVAGGASAAARARRLSENADIVLFERGDHISFANCGLPYHIGGIIKERDRLLIQTPAAMKKRFGIDVRVKTEVVSIDRAKKQVLVKGPDGSVTAERYDALVLSPGAEPVRLPIPGADSPKVFTLRSLSDMDTIKRVVDEGKPAGALVIGGGYIGLEMAEALTMRGVKVTIVELETQVFGPIDPEMATPIHQHLKMHGVDLRLGMSVTSFRQEGARLLARLSNGEGLECDMAIMSVGVRPESKLAKDAGLAIGSRSGIAVDEHMRTSDESIWAVGDAVQVTDFVGGFESQVPLAGPANRQGRIAADNIFGRPSTYRKTQGTAICKVFDLAVAMTGLSEKVMVRRGMSFEKVYIHPADHAGYYPGASQMTLKLLFDLKTGRVLGAQGVGTSGVDKRIDIIAVAIRAGLTVADLQDLELCYAPPYGSAKDPVNYAGFVATNALRGDMKLCHTADVVSPSDDQVLLDVRTPAEVMAGTIPGATNIPVDELRGRLGELPKNKEILAFCQVGLRGYLACRILSQNGFACRNLTGGYRTYTMAAGVMPVKPQRPADDMKSDTGEKDEAAKPAEEDQPGIAKHVDARGLQCPGPIMQLKKALDAVQPGQVVTISCTDPGFTADITGWCHSTGNKLMDVSASNGAFNATIVRGAPQAAPAAEPAGSRNKTMVVFSGDFDKAMAAFIIANGAASMGSKVTMFFTFWGLNILRRPEVVPVRKNLIERMFGWMMPCGADKLALSKMNMGGMGLVMIKGIMRRKNVTSLPDLIASARKAGVRLVACSMSMDLMGIKRQELIDEVEEGGVAMYLDSAEASSVNLFI